MVELDVCDPDTIIDEVTKLHLQFQKVEEGKAGSYRRTLFLFLRLLFAVLCPLA